MSLYFLWMSANNQYIPLKNEYILHSRLNIYCICLRIYLHRQMQYYCVFNPVGLADGGHSYKLKIMNSYSLGIHRCLWFFPSVLLLNSLLRSGSCLQGICAESTYGPKSFCQEASRHDAYLMLSG